MTVVNSHPPGAFCWIELATSDAGGAIAFYSRVFGWSVREVPMGDFGTYFIFQKKDRDVAAMYQQGPDMQGIPPNWLSYVAVSSADAAVEKAKSLGGSVMTGPFDVFDQGRMAVLSDPQGAVFAVWQAKTNAGIGLRDETNTLCWNELQARDLNAARQFYVSLFGWRVKESPEYVEFHLGENAVGGMMQSKAPEGVPSFWLPYIAVEDCDATVENARALGSQIHVMPMDIEKVGRFAVLTDPQGASVAVIKLMM